MTANRCFFLWLGILALASQHATAQSTQSHVVTSGPVELTVELDRVRARVAEPVELRLQVDAPQGTSITFPATRESLGSFSILRVSEVSDLPIEQSTTDRRTKMTIEMESLESGNWQIPELKVLYRLPDGYTDVVTQRDGTLTTEPMTVQILSVLSDDEQPNQFRDIKDIATLPTELNRGSSGRWWVVGAVCGVGGLIACLVWLMRRPAEPPAKWALAEIEQIEAAYDQKRMEVGQAYTKLDWVLRQYLEAQLAIPATSLSGSELIRSLADSPYPDSAQQRLRRFVSESDELKFSGRMHLGPQHDESPFDSVRAIVHETSDDVFKQPDREAA